HRLAPAQRRARLAALAVEDDGEVSQEGQDQGCGERDHSRLPLVKSLTMARGLVGTTRRTPTGLARALTGHHIRRSAPGHRAGWAIAGPRLAWMGTGR